MVPRPSPREVFTVEDTESLYPLLTAVVVPRPIAWITSRSAAGVGNLAPHSFFTVACASPPVVQFTSVRAKDTLRNVTETGEFVVNLASLPLRDAVNASSAPFDPDVDEAAHLAVALEPSNRVSVPRVTQSPASIECTLHSTLDLGDSTVVLGDVRAITVERGAIQDGHPQMSALQPLSRLGRNEWGMPPAVFALDRPGRP